MAAANRSTETFFSAYGRSIWKGRKLKVADRPQLRPTMDRVRETLFNWLVADIRGARVLDLFAGTGALAFEALSRGAVFATLIERDRATALALRSEATRLGADCEVVTASATAWLKRQTNWVWDLVFVDPPFESNIALPTLDLLKHHDTTVYLEQRALGIREVPGWETIKSARAGECDFRLIRPEQPPAGL